MGFGTSLLLEAPPAQPVNVIIRFPPALFRHKTTDTNGIERERVIIFFIQGGGKLCAISKQVYSLFLSFFGCFPDKYQILRCLLS